MKADISEILGPLWSQNILYKEKSIIFSYNAEGETLNIKLTFDNTFEKYNVIFDTPNNNSVSLEYMNTLEGYFYGLYLIFACQHQFVDYIQDIKEEFVVHPQK